VLEYGTPRGNVLDGPRSQAENVAFLGRFSPQDRKPGS
jgi:hypothetical protein